MQTTENILQALRRFGQKGVPLERIYRHLYNPDLYLVAYDKIGRHPGSMTPGIDGETADGTNLGTFNSIIVAMRKERYHFKPTKRVYILKKNGRRRPLGLPSFSDKLVQEALRLMLEAYYEPLFRECSHGFRPGRGCHSALEYIRTRFRGTVWFIEGDIKGCFEHIDHELLMAILAKRIHDGRILELIRRYLKAGYMEEWHYHRTYSGTPQGGVLSPLLANIYLHELDTFIMDELQSRYHRGKKRRHNPPYYRLTNQINALKRAGRAAETQELDKQRRSLPALDPDDPDFRRLRYCRYADDFIIGFIGPRSEAEEITREIGRFLRERLHLDLSEEKTLITHAKTGYAVFLNYAVSIYHANTFMTAKGAKAIKRRSANGRIRLGIPYGLVDEKCKGYMRRGRPVPGLGLLPYSDAHIIMTYQTTFRGIAEYYKYAVDRYRLGKLKHVMEWSLTQTLARKHRSSVSQVYRKYRGTQVVDGYMYKTLQTIVQKGETSSVIRWGAIPLRTVKSCRMINDRQAVIYLTRSDLLGRMLKEECELCGQTEHLEVHHVRKLADLKTRWRGRREKPAWVTAMIAIRRKTLVVCHKCHTEIHRCGA